MSIKNKVISLVLLVFLVYAAVDYGVQRLFILPSFASLEQEEALKNMDRVVQAIDREIQLLSTKANDWGTWDEAYRFMLDQNDTFRESTLKPESLESLKINMIYIFNTNRQSLWGLIYDLDSQKEVDMPELREQLADISMMATDYKMTGFLVTKLGPLLIASRPILKSDAGGPPRGAMVFGQFLNASGIAGQTKANVSITILTGGKMAPEKADIAAELRSGRTGRTIIRGDGDTNRVYRVLPDLFGRPALLLQVDQTKTITKRGKESVHFALLSLFVAGLMVLISLYFGLRLIVLLPLARLTRHAVSIGQSNDLSERLDLKRQDELGKLTQEFNRMVERLQEAREHLAEQSYASGIAEMARGFLHNIGNAITPLRVKLTTLKNAFQQAPIADMDMAVAELADPATPEDRRADLSQFLELAGMELSAVVKQATLDLEQIRNQVDHVQLILDDQHRFSQAQRVIQSLDLSSLVMETIDLLSVSIRKSVVVEQDPTIGLIGKVQAARIALQQVISNLLINAAESVHGSGKTNNNGRIRIHGAEELLEGVPMAHLRIEDNGGGIPPEKLSKIFERGFSTKNRGSGLGLHWSSNTIAALKGRLYAESKGEGQGAIFHLLLPLAETNTERKDSAS